MVVAWHDVAFGPQQWPLPRCLRHHPDAAARAAVFASALLDGKAFQMQQQQPQDGKGGAFSGAQPLTIVCVQMC